MTARLRVRLTPSGGADRIDGVGLGPEGAPYLRARVRAPPEDGKANTALEALIAKALGVAKGNARVIRGQTARMKTLEIEAVGDADVDALLARFATD